MEPPRRVILVPQLPVKMRYQEGWPRVLAESLRADGVEVTILGTTDPYELRNAGEFSLRDASVEHELSQIQQYLHLRTGRWDILLHCDLSWPGLFSSVLFHKRPYLSFAICHATSRNRYDVFSSVRAMKWKVESATARLYNGVFVATQYHADKLRLPNAIVTHGLPDPPEDILHRDKWEKDRPILLCSVSRPSAQKVTVALEQAVCKRLEETIHRPRFLSWEMYYRFLSRCRYMLITSKEETYGYAVVDAVRCGCVPIAPRAYSYPELLPDELLYDPAASMKDRVDRIVSIVQRRPKAVALKKGVGSESFFRVVRKELCLLGKDDEETH